MLGKLTDLLPDEDDARHVFQAARNSIDYFITCDQKSILKWLADQAVSIEAEDVEDDVHDANVLAARQHALTDQGEVRASVSVEGDQLAVKGAEHGEAQELGQQRCHVPTAAATNPEASLGAQECAEAVPFELVGVLAACGKRAGAGEHGFRERRRSCHLP